MMMSPAIAPEAKYEKAISAFIDQLESIVSAYDAAIVTTARRRPTNSRHKW